MKELGAEHSSAEDSGPDEDPLVALVVAYQAGRLEGFERLYAALASDLGRYFAAAVHDHDRAQDLVQDTFMEIHRSLRTYLPPLPVRPWVFGIARHVLARQRRAAWRRARHEDASLPVEDLRWLEQPPSASLAAGSTRIGGVEVRDVEAAWRGLPAPGREVWRLHHVEGWSFQEIAARFRIGVGAAKLRSSRAMKTLRRALGLRQGEKDG